MRWGIKQKKDNFSWPAWHATLSVFSFEFIFKITSKRYIVSSNHSSSFWNEMSRYCSTWIPKKQTSLTLPADGDSLNLLSTALTELWFLVQHNETIFHPQWQYSSKTFLSRLNCPKYSFAMITLDVFWSFASCFRTHLVLTLPIPRVSWKIWARLFKASLA